MAGDDSTTTADVTNEHSLHLLLHCVDGAIPYLTPHLLEKCFPANKVKDVLMLGLAVRDTAISPMFRDSTASKTTAKKKGSDDNNKKSTTNSTLAPKPCGYTFSSSIPPDSWLLDYSRITVPTFDPYQDALKFSPKHVADASTITASNQHIMVWTENGRQALTTELYHEAATKGLKAKTVVSLFDMCLPDFTARRRRAAFQRTNEWRQQAITIHHHQQQQSSLQETKPPNLWTCCLVSPQAMGEAQTSSQTTPQESFPEIEQQYESIQTALQQQSIQGVAFVGWQYGSNLEQQRSLLESTIAKLRKVANPATTTLTVLSTHSFSQFLECYRLGMHVIGTALPAKWAKEKRAFVCDFMGWKQQQQQHQTEEPSTKRQRVNGGVLHTDSTSIDEDGCISMVGGTTHQTSDENDNVAATTTKSDVSSWVRDDRPILLGCSCLTCQKHSRAYLYHLVMTKELLAEILLFIHNLHHMMGLCRELAKARGEGEVEDICRFLKTSKN